MPIWIINQYTETAVPEQFVGAALEDRHGTYHRPITLTYIVPGQPIKKRDEDGNEITVGACNQFCPHCIITEESEEPVIGDAEPEHYDSFTNAFLIWGLPVSNILVQGYEPLLPHAWEYTKVILDKSNHINHRKPGPIFNGYLYSPQTGFITNGALLGQRAEEIYYLNPDSIAISIDGGDPEINDYHRGSGGAFMRIIGSKDKVGQIEMFLKTIDRLSFENDYDGKYLNFADKKLEISSTLHDEKTVQSLKKLPAEMKRLGITKWAISPLVIEKSGHLVLKHPQEKVVEWSRQLAEAAKEHDVTLRISDEFDTLHAIANDLRAVGVDVSNLESPDDIYRFYPDRTYTRGRMNITPYGYPGRNYKWNKSAYTIRRNIAYPKSAISNHSSLYFLVSQLGYDLPELRKEWLDQCERIMQNPESYISHYGQEWVDEILNEYDASKMRRMISALKEGAKNENKSNEMELAM